MLGELSQILGEEQLLRFLQRFGGTVLYVPLNPGVNHPITGVLGVRGAAKFASHFGGTTVCIPLGRKWVRAKQKKIIQGLLERKATCGQVALRVGCTQRWVRMVEKEAREGRLRPKEPVA